MGEKLELPLDVVYYILVGLPVKSLSRFWCVSKQWCSIIFDPHFLKEHSCRSKRRPLFLVASGTDDTTLIRFKTYNDQGFLLREFTSNKVPPFCMLIQSCLGLVCILLNDESVCLCNPSTEEIAVLPSLPEAYLTMCTGFGYTASTEEYKVVRFYVKDPYDEDCCCDVFTVGTNGCWREAKTPPPYEPRHLSLPFLHGALHLLSVEELQTQRHQHYIAVFDLNTEEYRVLPFPEIYFPERSWADDQLCELRGSLCFTLASNINRKILQVWLLKNYHGGEWVKQYNIDLSSESYYMVNLLALLVDSCILLNLYPPNGPKKSELCCYNTQQNCLENKIATNYEATFYLERFSSVGSSHNNSISFRR